MGRYVYTVQDSRGDTTTGALDAGDENEAISSLQNKGFFILSIQADKAGAKGASKVFGGGGGVSGRDLVFFGEQLATLLNGGVPLVRALSLLGEHSESPGLKAAVGQITKDVASGASLHKAMERHPKIFDSLWISLVQAGEMGGQLPKALKQIGSYLSSQEELKGKVITALAYPGVLFIISMSVLVFFIVKIVPTFADIFKSFDLKLPAITQLIIFISNALVHNLMMILIGIAGVVFTLKGYLATEAGQFGKARFMFSIPFFGDFLKNIQVERLLTTLCTLIESGVSILNAITVLEGVFTSNKIFEAALRGVKSDVATGKSISAAFKKTGVFPPLVVEMMWMGEESGKLPDILSTLSVFYREQVDQFIRRFTAIIDPIMVVFIGGIVGVIVLSIFMPIFQLSQLGGGGG
ncbi:MAG: type II secretion system F family protein [Elusimicrobia bacterium]|nr:type II secretion system F family protein [Elusimicrobiota bacterium]